MNTSSNQIQVKRFRFEAEAGGYAEFHADGILIANITSYYIHYDAEEGVQDIQLYQVDEHGFMRTIEVLLEI